MTKAPDWAHDDDALQAMIQDALDPDDTQTMPPALRDRMIRAAKSAYVWRTVDDELERLVAASDSTLEPAVRALQGPRLVQFQGESLTVELEIADHFIVGQVYPTQSGTVTLTPASGSAVEVSTDEMGCFTIDRPAGGPFRLRCVTPESSVITEWLT